MARKQQIVISRFDGGMSDAIRDTSNPTKFAYISHFDIYRDPNQMYVMPGFESVNGFGGNATGIKVHDIRAFTSGGDDRVIYGVGTKSDGTGSKVFQWNEGTPDTEWSVASLTVEGTHNLVARPFLANDLTFFLYPVVNSGALNIGKNGTSAYTNFVPNDAVGATDNRYMLEKGFDALTYVVSSNFGDIRRLNATELIGVKGVGGFPQDIASGDYTIGIAQTLLNPARGNILIWDAASLLADQNIRVSNYRPQVIGYLKGGWVVVAEQGLFESTATAALGNGLGSFEVSLISGESLTRQFRMIGFPAAQHTENALFPIKGSYEDGVLFYARIATNSGQTEYQGGVFAVGMPRQDSQLGYSQLINTESLGVVENVFNSGRRFYFAHGNDGSVSRLQRFDTGTYNVPAVIETLVYGSNSPYLKELNGISVVTENLPASASVKVDYRTDVDSAWVELGTSSITNKQKHVFTRAQGTPIGRFQEIQFRITCTGKIVLKNIKIDLTETSDLAF